jgi:hypothetical protein
VRGGRQFDRLLNVVRRPVSDPAVLEHTRDLARVVGEFDRRLAEESAARAAQVLEATEARE